MEEKEEEEDEGRVSREDFLDGGVVGLDGFCLRRCAISSQWLNRSFASPSFSTSSSSSSATLSSSSSFGVSHVTSLSSHSRVSFNALSSLSLAVPDGDAVLSSVTSDLCAKISFRCHAFALRLEVSVVLHFLGCHAFARMALPVFFLLFSPFVNQFVSSLRKGKSDHREAMLYAGCNSLSSSLPRDYLATPMVNTLHIIRTCLQYRCYFTLVNHR